MVWSSIDKGVNFNTALFAVYMQLHRELSEEEAWSTLKSPKEGNIKQVYSNVIKLCNIETGLATKRTLSLELMPEAT